MLVPTWDIIRIIWNMRVLVRMSGLRSEVEMEVPHEDFTAKVVEAGLGLCRGAGRAGTPNCHSVSLP